jgi:hypothetical protein
MHTDDLIDGDVDRKMAAWDGPEPTRLQKFEAKAQEVLEDPQLYQGIK